MENLSGIMRAVLQGFMDSFKGGIIIFYLDKQIKERSKRSSPNKDPKTRRRREPSRDPALMKQEYSSEEFSESSLTYVILSSFLQSMLRKFMRGNGVFHKLTEVAI
ncbi:Etoposide-induced protein 2.4 [Gryllus bimaculatus]|nr:Etoposide-induced protein 2.4 [Gryllus bimaculatus]